MESEEEYEVSRKAVEDKFKQLYDEDPELRQVLGKADPSTFSVEEKYQIIEAYIHQGGAAGLQIEMEDEDEEELDEATIEQMSAADKKTIED